jgi:hypothetical protein
MNLRHFAGICTDDYESSNKNYRMKANNELVRQTYNEKLYNFNSLPNIIKATDLKTTGG